MHIHMTRRSSARTAFLAGLRTVAPLLLGVVPFGLVYGATALAAGLSVAMSQGMSAIIFAGASQFVVAQLIDSGTPALIILLIAALINLRHVLYSASIGPYVRHLPARWRWLLSYLLTDEAYAVAITNYTENHDPDNQQKHWYFLGAGVGLWATWQSSTAAGILLGAALPADWSLDFAIPLTFIALVVPVLKDRANVAAALTASIAAVVAAGLPHNLGLVVAILLGMLIGLGVELKPALPPLVERQKVKGKR